MYRRTKSHCKTDEEAELYRQQLCKLYLIYLRKGIACVDRLEPVLSNILRVKKDNSINISTNDRLGELRKKVAERTIRIQSLLMMQNRLKTENKMADMVIFKSEPIVYKAEKELTNIKCVSSNDILSDIKRLNRVRNTVQSLVLN